jgi:homoaconitase/3-isopropylmalate dehydratase large subunit
MTMTEKIFARASEKTQLSPGENVWVNVDILMTHDVCGPGSIGIFKKEFGENAKVLACLMCCKVISFVLMIVCFTKILMIADCEADMLN